MDSSRRVYRLNDIDWDYVGVDPLYNEDGLTNLQLALKGNSPYYKDNTKIELHHSTQTEPGDMIEIPASKHDMLTMELHISFDPGSDFKNDPFKDNQYKRIKYNYWVMRAKEVQKGINK